jgi:short-subunit dehydrogenase
VIALTPAKAGGFPLLSFIPGLFDMNVSNAVALVTGANRGIGSAFVAELLKRGVKKVYLAARDTTSLRELLKANDPRLVPLPLDVTDPDQVAAAASVAKDVTLLINNAGFAAFEGAISADTLDRARIEMDVNYFGVLDMSRNFAPVLKANGGGAIVNMLSMLSFIALPVAATYSASKAAAMSVTRSLRAELLGQGTQVVGVLAVQTETEMGVALPEPRMTPAEVVSDALDALEAGTSDEVAAGAQTKAIFEKFQADPKGLQAKMSQMLPAKA